MKPAHQYAVIDILQSVIHRRGSAVVISHGRSMMPWIPDGSLVSLTQPDAELKTGMVVAVRYRGRLLIHRVVRITRRGGVVTKGDNLPFIDGEWDRRDVIGRVVEVRTPAGRILPLPDTDVSRKLVSRMSSVSGGMYYILDAICRIPVAIACSRKNRRRMILRMSSILDRITSLIFRIVHHMVRINYILQIEYKGLAK